MTIIVLTGAPGVGKTTAIIRVARALKERGVKVGGIVSRELRTNNRRIGFEFIDLSTNDRNVWLLSLEMVLRLESISLTLQGAALQPSD
ncbi:MAG: nucleoside-triphosphatase [Nitrososphaeraceae archaeon]